MPHQDSFPLLDEAFSVSCTQDLDRFFELVEDSDVFDREHKRCEDSKSKHLALTQLTFFIYPVSNRPLLYGRPPIDIPDKWIKSRSVFALQKRRKKLYEDNLCAFRAVWLFLKRIKNPKFRAVSMTPDHIKALYTEFRQEHVALGLPEDPMQFKGCSLTTVGGFVFGQRWNRPMIFSRFQKRPRF